MNKSITMLTLLFAVSTYAHANTIQLADFEAPGEAAAGVTSEPPPPPEADPVVINPSTQNQPGTQSGSENGSGNCNNSTEDSNPVPDVPSDNGSAPTQGS